MARFAQTRSGTDQIVNYEGETAYKLKPELELYSVVCTSVLCSKFYDAGDQTGRIAKLVRKCSPVFVAGLARYARQEMHLRSVPIVLAVEMARAGMLTRQTVLDVVQRADEIVELLACYQKGRSGTKKLGKLSKAVQRGIKEILESGRFDEYQFAKYDRKTDVTLRDAVFLVHPDPKKNPTVQKIVDQSLPTPYTWETVLSERGNKKDVWEELIDSGKVGYMALMRNLRNILMAGVSLEHVQKVGDRLSDPEQVVKSRQLPFRFLAAYRELKEVESPMTGYVQECLERAVSGSARNIAGFDVSTSVLIACDVSGSMQTAVSPQSKVQYFDIGLVLGMLLQSRCRAVTSGMFGNHWKTIGLPTDKILGNADELHRREGEVGYSTNGWKVLEWAVRQAEKGVAYDKIMIFTDCQMWRSAGMYGMTRVGMPSLWAAYRKIVPTSKLYLFDMAGYGMTPLSVRQDGVVMIAGWSDKIFDVITALDNSDDVIKMISSD